MIVHKCLKRIPSFFRISSEASSLKVLSKFPFHMQLLCNLQPLTSIFTINHKSKMAATPVVFILGSGPRIGASVAEKFASNGYKVAIASRKGTGNTTDKGYLSLKADFTKPDTVPALFDAVKTAFQTFPSVVIYNAAALTPPPEKDSVLSILGENVALDLNVNTVSPYVAAQQAIRGWKTLPKETKKTFIFTGNISNVSIVPMPMTINLGMGKAASAYWIGVVSTLNAAEEFR